MEKKKDQQEEIMWLRNKIKELEEVNRNLVDANVTLLGRLRAVAGYHKHLLLGN